MLVLSRKSQQRIQIGDSIVITILAIRGRSVRVGIEAPRDIHVVRSELCDQLPAGRLEFRPEPANTRSPLPAEMSEVANDDPTAEDCRRFRRLPGRNRLRRWPVQVAELATSEA